MSAGICVSASGHDIEPVVSDPGHISMRIGEATISMDVDEAKRLAEQMLALAAQQIAAREVRP